MPLQSMGLKRRARWGWMQSAQAVVHWAVSKSNRAGVPRRCGRRTHEIGPDGRSQRMTEILVYTKTVCPYCDRAKALLKSKGVSWEEINLDQHPEHRDEMIRKSDGRRTVPQVFVNGVGLGGSDDIHALDRDGKLDGILGLKGNGK